MVEMAWDIPLSLVSFLFYRIVRFLLRSLLRLYTARNPQEACHWRALSAEMLDKSLALPIIMTAGPRWNTHAIVAGVGPLRVRKSLSVHTGTAWRSAPAWIIVVNRFPSHRVVANMGSASAPIEDEWTSAHLEPGSYSLALRYYHWSHRVEFPAVKVDGVEEVQTESVSSEVNAFYHDLHKRRSIFYLCLHYYIFTILRYKEWLPQSFVERELLPMGNLETHFYYGTLTPEELLSFELAPMLLSTHDIFLTIYGRDSFPVRWYQIHEARHITSNVGEKCFYLVRIHEKSSFQRNLIDDWVKIRVVQAD